MLFLLSPAKSLDYDTPVPEAVWAQATQPQFMSQAAQLIRSLKPLTPAEVARLMDLSDPLAQLNVGRYAAWRRTSTPANSQPAVLAFDGDVYQGLDARRLDLDSLQWMQQHVMILSGLYGALRPLDLLQPYRLEMGTPLATAHGKDLYAFWGDTVVKAIHKQLRQDVTPVVVNLASQEYSKVALRKSLKAPVVHCHFEDFKGGDYKVISFFAKVARGRMCRWAVEQRLSHPEQLRDFAADGYALDAAASQARGQGHLVFRRRLAD